MKPRIVVASALCWVFGSLLFAQEKPELLIQEGAAQVDSETAGPAAAIARERRIRAVLDEQTQIEFLDTPLREAIDFLASQHGIPILLDEPSLTDEGIATDEPVTLSISDVSLRSALRLILAPLKLTYVIEDEVMKIVTSERAKQSLRIELYDIRTLQAAEFPQELLVRLIEQKVGRDQWVKHEGHGTIETVPNALIVLQTEEAHDAIAAMLADLSPKAAALNPPQ